MSGLYLYELGNSRGQSASPYCWRILESLHLLSLPYKTEQLGFTEIQSQFSGRHKTVPVLIDGKNSISDSWAIANYLADNYDPDNHLLGTAENFALSCFVTRWVDASVLRCVNKIIVKDIHDGCLKFDQAYYRAAEEKRFGQTLEELHKNRQAELPALQTCLHPARQAIKDQHFLGGNYPTYADIALHSAFQWSRTVSDFQLLRSDDRLHCWISRMDDWAASSR